MYYVKNYFSPKLPDMKRIQKSDLSIKNPSSAVSAYLEEIKKTRVLQREEEYILAVKMHHGDEQARESLIKANLKFSVRVALNYYGLADIEDLLSWASIGTYEATRRFDPNLGNKFISYAVKYIQGRILSELSKKNVSIGISQNKHNYFSKLRQDYARLCMEEGYIPIENASSLLDVSIEDINRALTFNGHDDIPNDEKIEKNYLSNFYHPEQFDTVISQKQTGTLFSKFIAEKLTGQYELEIVGHLYGIGSYELLDEKEIMQKFNLSYDVYRLKKTKALGRLINTREQLKKIAKL